jgi:uncharacterized protein (DUF362 family)
MNNKLHPFGFKLTRRQFLKEVSLAMTLLGTTVSKAALVQTKPKTQKIESSKNAKISLVKTTDRREGISKAISLLDLGNQYTGKKILIKPNFNTADPFPASTHNDTLIQIIDELRKLGASQVTIGERSGPPPTESVMQKKGIYQLAEDNDISLINFDELPPKDWVLKRPERSHWRNGFRVASPVLDAEEVVSTCCLKTHRYGGVFTMSLKLSVGIVPRRGYDYMSELHSSPHMRKMIAEINQVYSPSLVIMDGMEVFVDGGPAFGVKKTANLIIAGSDRVAIDALGVAVLKSLGSNDAIMGRKVFHQEQIARAVELVLGVDTPARIEIVTPDLESRRAADQLMDILKSEA